MKREVVGKEPAPRPRLAGWRLWLARVGLMVGAPAAVLLLLEGGLRVAGFGVATTFFRKAPDGSLVTNRGFARQFAPPELAPGAHPLRLAPDKPAGGCRVFVLGESAAMGTPEPAFGFGRILEAMLREQLPGVEVEVVNCGVTAINSHLVLPIAREAARRHGDVYIVYMGNNEVVGPFGPATIFKQFTPSRRLIGASLAVKRTRTGQLLAGLLDGARPGMKEWKGMENWAAQRVAHDDPRRAGVYQHFAANLREILDVVTRDGAAAIACTLAVNLRDCPPFASQHRGGLDAARTGEWEHAYAAGVAAEERGDHAGALAQYRAALAIDGEFADLRFRIGRCLAAAGDAAGALAEFSAARDLDALQFRPDERIQSIIREVAGSAGPRVVLADVAAAFAASPLAAQGIPGRALLWEHVHMTFEGNHLIASRLLPHVLDALPEPLRGRARRGDSPDLARCAELLCHTDFERAQCAASIRAMMARPPFTGQLDHARRMDEFSKWQRQLAAAPEALRRSLELHAQAVAQRPDDWQLRVTYSAALREAGQAKPAREQLDAAIRLMPGLGEATARAHAQLLMLDGRGDEAITAFQGLLERHGETAELCLNLGSAYLLKGELDQAESWLGKAHELDPGQPAAIGNLASARLRRGDLDGAETLWREALAVAEDAGNHLNLANVLRRRGRHEEALQHLRRAAGLDPRNPAPRFGIAGLRMQAGDKTAAEAELRATLDLDPRHGQAHALLAQILLERSPLPDAATMAHMRAAWEAGAGAADLLGAYSWFLAAHPDAALRDGSRAMQVALQACGTRPSAAALRSLAAAHAEAGNFAEAVRVARQARDLALRANQAALAGALASNIAAYEQRRTVYQER